MVLAFWDQYASNNSSFVDQYNYYATKVDLATTIKLAIVPIMILYALLIGSIAFAVRKLLDLWQFLKLRHSRTSM